MGSLPVVARADLHYWEEPCISGTRGSGAVFFSGCPLRCVFCQNEAISRGGAGQAVDIPRLAQIFAELEARGANNINLVSPTHFVPQILAALRIRKPGIPVIYNTGGYERVETLRSLAGWVDVYLPDLKYMDAAIAARYASAPDYPARAQAALLEMRRQTGPARYSPDGLLLRGTLVRHLVLPGLSGQAMRALTWVADHLGSDTPVSLMGQYTPMDAVQEDALLGRRLTRGEYERVAAHARVIGLPGYLQALDAASAAYIPPFDGRGVTFPPDTAKE
jgi:putative pyruvate formate lyase activating enzyme